MKKEETFREKFAREKAEQSLRKVKQLMCKNAKISLVMEKKEWKPKNMGCERARRNGSAYCKECSEAFNQLSK